jgi:hypothetical protein
MAEGGEDSDESGESSWRFLREEGPGTSAVMPRGFVGEPGSSRGRTGVLSKFGTGSGAGIGEVGVNGLVKVVEEEVVVERGLNGRRSFAKAPVW